MQSMYKLKPSCNLSTIRDGRGGIFTYIPPEPILECTVLFTKAGSMRGFHCHHEFIEIVVVLSGHGVYVEKNFDSEEYFLKMGPGEAILFPKGCYHTWYPITDTSMVALLTKCWDDCEVPMVSAFKGDLK